MTIKDVLNSTLLYAAFTPMAFGFGNTNNTAFSGLLNQHSRTTSTVQATQSNEESFAGMPSEEEFEKMFENMPSEEEFEKMFENMPSEEEFEKMFENMPSEEEFEKMFENMPSEDEWEDMFSNVSSGSYSGMQMPNMDNADFQQMCEQIVGDLGDAVDDYRKGPQQDYDDMTKAAEDIKKAIKSLEGTGYDTSTLSDQLDAILDKSGDLKDSFDGIIDKDLQDEIDCSNPESIANVLESLEGDLDGLGSNAEDLADLIEKAMSQFEEVDFGSDMDNMPSNWEAWDDKTGMKNFSGLTGDSDFAKMFSSQSPFAKLMKK